MDAPAIYLHDGSFEGLLHAVAQAVKSGQSVNGIYAEKGYSPQLFDRLIRIETDRLQASRLFDYLQNLKGEASRLAMNGFLSEDREVGLHLYRLVRQCLVRGSGAIRLYSHDSIRYLERLSRRVGHEAHRFTGLIRFRILAGGIQYGPFEPDCNVIGYCAHHFIRRLKSRNWILHDIRRNYALYWDGDTLQHIDVDEDFTNHVHRYGEIPDNHLNPEEYAYQELWKSFHTVIANSDRENRNLQRHFMPRRYWKYLVEMPK